MEKLKRKKYHLRLYLYHARVDAGFTAYEFSMLLGLHPQHYYQIENGYIYKYGVDLLLLDKIARLLRQKVEDLLISELYYQKECLSLNVRLEKRPYGNN
jgi:DNA-binding XRE family transcriptional regulator